MSTRVTDLNLTIIPGKSIVTGEGNGKIGKMEELHTANKVLQLRKQRLR